MDFHSLTRRELQSLCKLNKIPANITNVAMADALQSLQIVEGIEEYLNVSQSETNGLVESTENVEASQTRCRTTTRQKVKIGETENLPPTATRTTRRGSKQLATGDVEESKTNMAKTPAVPTTRRKALATSSCRNVNSRLNECEEDAKKESTVQKAYSTRRSTRLTEKKSAESRVQKESGKAVKMNSFVDEMDESMDEVNVTSEEVGKLDEVPVNSVESGKSNVEVEGICHAFEKLDVLIEESAPRLMIEKVVEIEVTHQTVEEKDCGELSDNLKLESSDETPNQIEEGDSEEKVMIEEEFDLGEKVSSEEEAKNIEVADQKTESDSISTPSEDGDSEAEMYFGDNFDDSEVSTKEISGDNLSAAKDQEIEMAQEEGDEEIDVDATAFNTKSFSGPQELEQEHIFSAVSEMKDEDLENNGYSSMVDDMILSNVENPNEALESDNISTVDEITTMDTEQVSENKVDVTLDVIPTVDNNSTIIAEAQDLKPRLFTEFREFPNKKTHSKTPTSFKTISIISDDKENIESGRKLQNVFVDEGNKIKIVKDENENEKAKSLHENSMRQLRKQLKNALTLKNLNANETASTKDAATRPALQVLCENQLVGGETMK